MCISWITFLHNSALTFVTWFMLNWILIFQSNFWQFAPAESQSSGWDEQEIGGTEAGKERFERAEVGTTAARTQRYDEQKTR